MTEKKANSKLIKCESDIPDGSTKNSSHIYQSDKPKHKFSNQSYLGSDVNICSFLDYTFRDNRYNINSDKKKDRVKLKNYNFELENTLKLNMELLYEQVKINKIDNESNENKNELLELIKSIKKKSEERMSIKARLKTQGNLLLQKNEDLKEQAKKIKEQIGKFNQKLSLECTKIDDSETYIRVMHKRFAGVQHYVNKLRHKTVGKKCKKLNIKDFLKENIRMNKEKNENNEEIKKLKNELVGIKKDNQLYHDENKLYRAKNPNKDLIRVVEFYRRVIRSLYTRIKILNNTFNSLSKTLSYLSLSEIVNFQKSKINQEQTHYELDLSNLNKNDSDEEEGFNLYEKINKLMDFNTILGIGK